MTINQSHLHLLLCNVLRNFLVEEIKPCIDPFQFAYSAKRGVEDAVVTMFHKIYEHLDKPRSYVRMFSSVTPCCPHSLIFKLQNMNTHPYVHRSVILCLQVTQSQSYAIPFKRCGIQHRCSTGLCSVTNYFVYTSDLNCSSNSCSIVKCADDTSLTGFISNDDANSYRDGVTRFVNWSDENHPVINVRKTKEIIFDFRKIKYVMTPLRIMNEDAEIDCRRIQILGSYIDKDLNLNSNIQKMCGKTNQRLYFLRKLRYFNVDRDVMFLFYQSVIQSVITFCVWFTCLTNKNIQKLQRITRAANKVIGINVKEFHDIYEKALMIKLELIYTDATHPLKSQVTFSRSGRIVPSLKRTSRHRFSFLPSAIHLFNKRPVR